MTYRDDLEAAQSRIVALEKELDEERSKSQALVKAKSGPSALVRSASGSSSAQKWLGAPTKLELERELEGELPESAHTELVECIRRKVETVGTTTVLPGSLAWSAGTHHKSTGPFVNVYISWRDSKTIIRVDDKLGNLAGALYGGIGGGVGGGGIMLPIAAAFVSPWLLPITIPAWLGANYVVCRRLYRASSSKRAERLEQLLDELAEIARRHQDAASDAGNAGTPGAD
jgi:hypothetical protein